MLDGRIFRRHAKRVKAHGMQHIKAPHGAEAGNHVANGIVAHVAHMQIAGGIREHLQYIGFGFGRINLVSCSSQYCCHFFSMAWGAYFSSIIFITSRV